MSYLHSPRLIFSGDFRSDVSTVNTDTAHYNNTTFIPSFQEPGTSTDPNGWWNPEGGATFDFQNCRVQQLTLEDGTVQSDPVQDIVLGQLVAGAQGRPTGKMVDLDPDCQMVSALWCVQLRIYTSQHELLLQGDIATTSFRDLQRRQLNNGANRQPLGASWTSVLTNIVWGDQAASSPFLAQLRARTHDNKLSINLNGFGYYYTHQDGRFSLGRIIGSIGPWFDREPVTFAPARRLYGLLNTGHFAISNFLVEKESKRLTVDFGSSFPVADPIGTIQVTQSLLLAVSKKPINAVASATPLYIDSTDFTPIGPLPYQAGSNWLTQTGGIVSLADLPSETLEALANNQLLLLTPSSVKAEQFAIVAREAVNGLLVRADDFVQRLDCGDTNSIAFYAYQWGVSLPNTRIALTLEAPTPNTPLDPVKNPISELYGNNFPADGLTFPSAILTDNQGIAHLSITGNAIQSPRVYIDGQIYTIDYQVENIPNDYSNFAQFPDVVVVHLRDDFEVPETPTWQDIAPTMIQYSNLYPIMSKYLVNLGDPVALKAKKEILVFAFTRDIHDTMHMPVTRDLSKAKRQAILQWLHSSESITSSPTSIAKAQPKPENPISEHLPLTEIQLKYRKAVKVKSGLPTTLPAIENLFENI